MHQDRSTSRLTRTPTDAASRLSLDLTGPVDNKSALAHGVGLSPSCQDWKQQKLAKALLNLEEGSRSLTSSTASPEEASSATATASTFPSESSGGRPSRASSASNQLAIRIASIVVALLLLFVVLVYFNLSAIHRR
ncbi:uncharacterized protein LOC125946787 [Dermacentor silvarum]|uniref:uncharacterized protein LOC125946787 n=1 Tax=Dermacentor silvarum TaxID=543639 RepID=UPI002101B0AF|nr:uncharacterized protein LOC125946787 [Dermacentor silvarum]